MIDIRTGQPEDLPAVEFAQNACPEAAHWPVRDYLEHDFRVALCGRRLAGFLVARVVVPGEAEILNLAVSPDFRRIGVGKGLIRSFLDTFRGACFLEVRASNTGAREFYKYLGFQEIAVRKDYYDSPRECGVVMNFHS